MKFHRAAEIFPMLASSEINALAADIKSRGLREPICIHPDGSILDGRNRYLACKKAGVKPDTIRWRGKAGEELAYVISLNLHRRHLNESQRAMVAARVATMGEGRPSKTAPIGAVSQDDAADLLNVSRRTVQRARRVLDHAAPALIGAVDSGVMPVSFAARVAKTSKNVQTAIARAITSGTKPAEALRQQRKVASKAQASALPDGKYRVLYADPPWQYADSRSGLDDYAGTAAETHYQTMATDEICELPIGSMAATNSVLFCWATFPMLEDALRVVAAWGFKYKTAFVWSKVRPNQGHYHTADAELLLIATRGSCVPDADKLPTQVQTIERKGRHSQKPEAFRMLIDSLYTAGPRIEIFNRGGAPTPWVVWGNESA